MGLASEGDSCHADDASGQLFWFKGLRKDVIGTQQASPIEFDVLHCRDHQNLGQVQIGSETNVFDDVESTEAGHPEIEGHDARQVLTKQRSGGESVLGNVHIEVVLPQYALDGLRHQHIILDHEYSHAAMVQGAIT